MYRVAEPVPAHLFKGRTHPASTADRMSSVQFATGSAHQCAEPECGVNVVDLMRLFPARYHPHGMTTEEFVELFISDKLIYFAFPGLPEGDSRDRARAPQRRPDPRARLQEQGTTTTPFQM
jgi:hypothetical protein